MCYSIAVKCYFCINETMAWGLWNKIKNGFKKVGNAIAKGVGWVTDKVIKPFKPIISGVATAINPAAGAAITTGMNAVEKLSDSGFAPFKPLGIRR